MGAGDAELAARLAAGDDDALAEAFDRLAPVVHAAARRVLGEDSAAQDIVQDVFVHLWTHPDRYDPELAPLSTYLGVLARHRALDVIRSEIRRTARQELRSRLHPRPRPTTADEAVVAAEATRLVREAVQLLPPEQRRAVELAYFDGLSYREVAMAEGIPEGTAKSRLRLALAKLELLVDRQLLEQP